MLIQYILLKVRQSAFFSTTQVAHSSSRHLVKEPILHTLKHGDNYACVTIPSMLSGLLIGLVTENTFHTCNSIHRLSPRTLRIAITRRVEHVLVLARTRHVVTRMHKCLQD